MAKFKVVVSALFVDGVRRVRGDIVDIQQNTYGTKVEPVVEKEVIQEEKPVRRKKKVEPVVESTLIDEAGTYELG